MDLIVSPTIVALNTQSGAPKPTLTPGQLIDALVLQLIDATTVRLAIGDSIVDVKTNVPLEPGAHVRLAVRGHGDDIRWVIVSAAGAAATTGAAAATPRTPDAAPRNLPAAAHPALPATEVTIGANLPSADSDSVLHAPIKADQSPSISRTTSLTSDPANSTDGFDAATRTAAVRQRGLAQVIAQLHALEA